MIEFPSLPVSHAALGLYSTGILTVDRKCGEGNHLSSSMPIPSLLFWSVSRGVVSPSVAVLASPDGSVGSAVPVR